MVPGPGRFHGADATAMIEPRELGGFPDYPPEVMAHRERMMATFRATCVAFGYLPIGTPHVERMEVLTGKGAGSDEVVRQIYEVTNRGGTAGDPRGPDRGGRAAVHRRAEPSQGPRRLAPVPRPGRPLGPGAAGARQAREDRPRRGAQGVAGRAAEDAGRAVVDDGHGRG